MSAHRVVRVGFLRRSGAGCWRRHCPHQRARVPLDRMAGFDGATLRRGLRELQR